MVIIISTMVYSYGLQVIFGLCLVMSYNFFLLSDKYKCMYEAQKGVHSYSHGSINLLCLETSMCPNKPQVSIFNYLSISNLQPKTPISNLACCTDVKQYKLRWSTVLMLNLVMLLHDRHQIVTVTAA